MRAARASKWAAGAAMVLLATGAFLAWGPVGLGNGPLLIAHLDGSQGLGLAPRQPWGLFIAMDPGKTAMVIDRVAIQGGSGYQPPRVLGLWATRDDNCMALFPWSSPSSGTSSVLSNCAPGGLTRLTGHAIPTVTEILVRGQQVRHTGFTVVVKVAPPGRGGCWVMTSVIIHYHVGIRHYAATVPETFAACVTQQEVNAAERALGEPVALTRRADRPLAG